MGQRPPEAARGGRTRRLSRRYVPAAARDIVHNGAYHCHMPALYEFHISRAARARYQFDEMLLGNNGRLIVSVGSRPAAAGWEAAQRIAQRVFEVSRKALPASDIFAAAMIEEILHLLIRRYEMQNPGTIEKAVGALQKRLGARLGATLTKFTEEFPPAEVYRGNKTPEQYLAEEAQVPRRQVALEEMTLVRIANLNPALQPYKEFFDDAVLEGTAYREAISLLQDVLGGQPPIAAPNGAAETLFDTLLSPSRAAPQSLGGQLQFLLDRWGEMLGADIRMLILRAMDFVREEAVHHATPGSGHAAPEAPSYEGEPEYERFSIDQAWMPHVVMLAKNTYVWLEQLSRKYGRWIRTLGDIPDEELDLLRSRGFNALWLIGLWERSLASKRIKERTGRGDAVASAYSIHAYEIAADLGGWQALKNLSARAMERGLRLSADMVPNHMAIDSGWVFQHPERFLAADKPPFPIYSFHSEPVAEDGRVGIRIEDHYYDRSDAAVVFERSDRETGDRRYIYHGNDGTAFPWNDTAQLDFTRADVREAVIQTILHVARSFPIIRFDAAMTLARKQFQRLWFPEPGRAGAIPSRAAEGMTAAAFRERMPVEFWREVVDRVSAEVPDTLLLAEAFWLLEGYFVRTLGMHRVYNSAFMHMLRDEDNAKFREMIRNTLEFEPEILKRYVNFLSNPDEKTAVEQFGTGDKYFGACTILATLPGLPMFGHGQVEGLREKYGMDFRVPKWDEPPDEAFIRGHEWKIFPLLQRRGLLGGMEEFQLFDFYGANGKVNEDVIAYTNRDGESRSLVMVNNRYSASKGWLRTSCAKKHKDGSGTRQVSLGEALALPREGYAVFRDQATHLEYVRSCEELWENGLYAELGGYQHHVFLDWRFVRGGAWHAVHAALNGGGVASVQSMLEEAGGAEVVRVHIEGEPAKKPRKRVARKVATVKKAARKKTGAKKAPAKKRAAKMATKKAAKIAPSKKTPIRKMPVAKRSSSARKGAIKKALKSSKAPKKEK
jgi:glycosidase